MMFYNPTPNFCPADSSALLTLFLPEQIRALYRICCQAQTSHQQPHPDDFFDIREITADAAALAAVCLRSLTQLPTATVDNAPNLTAEG